METANSSQGNRENPRQGLPGDVGGPSTEEIEAAAIAKSYELGGVEASYAQIAAIEHLNELRASRAIGEMRYLREKRRILGQA